MRMTGYVRLKYTTHFMSYKLYAIYTVSHGNKFTMQICVEHGDVKGNTHKKYHFQ